MKQKPHWTDTVEMIAGAVAVLFIVLALTSISYAKTHEIRVFSTHERCVESIKLVKSALRDLQKLTNKRFRIVRRTCEFPIDEPLTLENRKDIFWKYNREVRNRKFKTLVLINHIEANGVQYVAGMSKYTLKLATINIHFDKLAITKIAIIHELLHLFKCDDDLIENSYMNYNALSFYNNEMFITNECKRKI
jgi:hypothetical protein